MQLVAVLGGDCIRLVDVHLVHGSRKRAELQKNWLRLEQLGEVDSGALQ